jgi:uncharacterized iron-regulated protein
MKRLGDWGTGRLGEEPIARSPSPPLTQSPSRWIAAVLLLGATVGVVAEDPLHLPIGDPARKDREVAVVLDGITETAGGTVLTPAELPARLAGVRLLLVGEEHTAMESHRVEKRVLEDLAGAGRRVSIGLEMYPYGEQPWLDQWVGGKLSEKEFVDQSRWYKNWGYHWGYYRDIFLLAGEKQMPMFAINTPREVVAAVRKKGFTGLTEEEAAHIPAKIDTESADHLRLFKASFGDEGFHTGMSDDDWKKMFEAQCTWDATMAQNAIAALKKAGDDEKTILVLLAGAGHVTYGLGIQRQASRLFSGKIATLVAVPVRDDKEKPVRTVRASYADYLWGVARETDPLYPELGAPVVAVADKGLQIIDVAKKSVAERAGLAVGDLLVSMDGTPIDSRETLSRLVGEKRWGDSASLVLRRGGETINRTAYFRREPADGEPAPAKQ